LVLWQQQKPTTTSFGSIVGRERIARLLLTKGSIDIRLLQRGLLKFLQIFQTNSISNYPLMTSLQKSLQMLNSIKGLDVHPQRN